MEPTSTCENPDGKYCVVDAEKWREDDDAEVSVEPELGFCGLASRK